MVLAAMTESRATELHLVHLEQQDLLERLELALVDRGTTDRAAAAVSARFGMGVRRVFWPDKQPVFRPLPYAWRVEVAHGVLGRARRLSKSFENTTTAASGWLRVACVALLLRELTTPV